jgi:C-terminal processing protease CtpA/Prc
MAPVSTGTAIDENSTLRPEGGSGLVPLPQPALLKQETPPPTATAPPEQRQPASAPEDRLHASVYWDQAAAIFASHREALDRETDPVRRMSLIRTLAGYVRVHTPAALDWAMGLEDTDERRAALEAINHNALSGIGVRIEVDDTGFPRIKDTTVLSAIASTGLVEQGDYIVGMMGENGQPIYFKDLPIHQIVQVLRGQPGTEVQLIMERVPAQGGTPFAFDVSVHRSMLVIQPPY